MRISHRTSVVIATAFAFSIVGPLTASAATAPDLGAASTYGVFGKAGVANTGAPTHIWGDVGADLLANITGLIASQVGGTMIGPAAGIQTAITAAYGQLDAQGADGGQTLSGTVTITPGVWTVGAALLNGTVTLNGAGVYILRSSSSITVPPGSQVILTNGASACNVFWQVPDAMTIGVGAHVEGTIIADTSLISLDTNASLKGRAFSSIAQVTLDSNQITEPTCGTTGQLTVTKVVVNDVDGTKVISDFPLAVDGASVTSGVPTTVTAGSHTVSEPADPGYTSAFGGDCAADGTVTVPAGFAKFCIITNDDVFVSRVGNNPSPVPPLIDVLKTASPLALPNGPGPVEYTYTLRNIGTVPVTDVTMVGDTCSPIVLASGDANNDAKLDVDETWVYHCSTNLQSTHTNTVTATGWANGISTSDIASATVVVGQSLVPPLIHVVKVPSVFTLPLPGGAVTYRYTVTNPGTVPLSNVTISDDKCTGLPGRVVGHPGDLNHNDLLESNEIWQFTCQSNLARTTTNVGTAEGSANGITARDLALATVVVASPGLPNTGFPPSSGVMPWVSAGILLLVSVYFVRAYRKRSV